MTKHSSAAKGSAMRAALLVPKEDDPTTIEAFAPAQENTSAPDEKIDGRSLHATGRDHAIATRIKKSTHQRMLQFVRDEKDAGNRRFSMAELIEESFELYAREHGRKG